MEFLDDLYVHEYVHSRHIHDLILVQLQGIINDPAIHLDFLAFTHVYAWMFVLHKSKCIIPFRFINLRNLKRIIDLIVTILTDEFYKY